MHKDIIFFENSALKGVDGGSQVTGEGGGGGDESDFDLETFDMQAQGWEEYGYKEMLALLQKMPPSVLQHALSIKKPTLSEQSEQPTTPSKLTLHAVYTAINGWVNEQRTSAAQLPESEGDKPLEGEEELLKRVEELLADQGHGTKSVSGVGKEGRGEREWVFAIKKMNYKMSIGLVSTNMPLFYDWFHPLHVDKVCLLCLHVCTSASGFCLYQNAFLPAS